MPELFTFSFQIAAVMRIGTDFNGNLLDDLQSVAFETDNLFGIISEQANSFQAKIGEDLCAETVLAEIHVEAELSVGFHRVVALFLQLIGFDFGRQANAASFLAHIDHNSATGFGNLAHGLMELRATIATAGTEDIAGEAFAVNADENIFLSGHFATNEGEMMLAIDFGTIEVKGEIAVIGWEVHDLDPFDQFFAGAAILDEIGDRADFEAILFGEFQKLRQACHGAVLAHDFANDADWTTPSEFHEVDGRLGVAGALEHASRPRAQGKDMPGLNKVLGHCGRIGHDFDGRGPVGGADPGGDTFRGIDADLEVGLKRFAILSDHAFDTKLLQALGGRGDADETTTVLGHEIHGCGRDELSGHNEVAFVFTIRVINDDDHFAGLNVGDDGFNGIELMPHRQKQSS